MSAWAYYQCLDGNNTEEMRNLITDSYWARLYCFNIGDREDMWKK